jgi:hypothetical protein
LQTASTLFRYRGAQTEEMGEKQKKTCILNKGLLTVIVMP